MNLYKLEKLSKVLWFNWKINVNIWIYGDIYFSVNRTGVSLKDDIIF